MSIKQIIQGHVNEALGKNDTLAEQRMSICKACPLYKMSSFGPICNPALYLNPTTNVASERKEEGMYKGCGCRLNAKTRLEDAHCPANKW